MTEGISYKKCTYNEEERRMDGKRLQNIPYPTGKNQKISEKKKQKKTYGRPLLRFRNIHLKP